MYQEIEIIGNVGNDPEMRYLPSGVAVTTMSVAANNTYRKADGEAGKTTVWFKVSVFNKQAETVSKYLKKGSKVFIKGRLTADDSGNPRIWKKQDGTPAASFEVTADTVKFLDNKTEDE